MHLPDSIKSLNDREYSALIKWLETSFEQIIFDENIKRRITMTKMLKRILGLRRLQISIKRSEKRKRDKDVQDGKAKKAKIDISKQVVLPNELWLKIMNQMQTKDLFGSFAQVCKQFNKLSKDSSAIKVLTVKDMKEPSQFKSLSKVIKRSKNLNEIKIEYSKRMEPCKHYVKHIMQLALKSCPKLKTLKIHANSWITQQCEKFLIEHGQNLEHLELKGVDFKDNRTAPVANFRKLKSLLISHGHGKTSYEDLRSIANNCTRLEKMHFKLLVAKDSGEEEYQKASGFHYFLKARRNTLKSLTINKVSDWSWSEDNILKNLAYCEKIEEVKLLDASFISNDVLDTLSHLPTLQKLELVNLGNLSIDKLDDFSYKNVMKDRKTLKMNAFFKKLNTDSLTYLSISKSDIITEENIKSLSKNGCPKLEKLVLEKCLNLILKEDTLKTLLEKCSQIKTLQFHWKMVTQISDKFWSQLSKGISIYISMGTSCLPIENFVRNKKGFLGQ